MRNVDFDALTVDQAETLDEAAALVINARQQAAAMLDEAGIGHVDDDGESVFLTHCTGNFDGSPCPCSHYSGPAPGPCQTKIAPPGVPFDDSTARCSHRPYLHLAT